MSADAAAVVAGSSASRPSVTARPRRTLARITNDPLHRAKGNTPEGRRVRDLYRAFAATLGDPGDPGTQAQVLTAAQLVAAAEVARTGLLEGRGDLDQVIRLENLSARALRRLGLNGKRAAPSDFSRLLGELP